MTSNSDFFEVVKRKKYSEVCVKTQNKQPSNDKPLEDKIMVRKLITYAIENGSMINIIIKKLNKYLSKNDVQEYNKVTIFECLVSYLLWEVFEKDENLRHILYNLKYTKYHPMFRIPFGKWMKGGRVSGFSRTLNDALKMIELVFEMNFDPFQTNTNDENIFETFEKSIENGYFPIEWKGEIENKIKSLMKNKCFIENLIKDVIKNVSTIKMNEYAQKFCWIVYYDIGTVAREIIKTFLILPPIHDNSGFWNCINNTMEIYKKMLTIGISNKYINDWNSEIMINEFKNSLCYEISIVLIQYDVRPTQRFDSIGAIIGECTNDEQHFYIQEIYLLDALNNKQYMNFIYCLSHGKYFSKTIIRKILEVYDEIPMLRKFQLGEIVKRELCPVYYNVIIDDGCSNYNKIISYPFSTELVKHILEYKLKNETYPNFNRLFANVNFQKFQCDNDLFNDDDKTTFYIKILKSGKDIIYIQKMNTLNQKVIKCIVINEIKKNIEKMNNK